MLRSHKGRTSGCLTHKEYIIPVSISSIRTSSNVFFSYLRLGGCYRHVISHQVNPFLMTVRLRLAVHGVRNNRIFHLVAIDQRKRRNAKPIELLGVYRQRVGPKNPHKSVEWSVDRIKYWLGVGAQPSDSVVKLLTKVRPVHANFVLYALRS